MMFTVNYWATQAQNMMVQLVHMLYVCLVSRSVASVNTGYQERSALETEARHQIPAPRMIGL